MALKDKWKDAGKGIGHAFTNFGKAVAKTVNVAVGEEERVDEEGKSTLKESWKAVGHGFGDAGKSLGKAAAGTANKVVGADKEEASAEAPSDEEPSNGEEKKEAVAETEVVEDENK